MALPKIVSDMLLYNEIIERLQSEIRLVLRLRGECDMRLFVLIQFEKCVKNEKARLTERVTGIHTDTDQSKTDEKSRSCEQREEADVLEDRGECGRRGVCVVEGSGYDRRDEWLWSKKCGYTHRTAMTFEGHHDTTDWVKGSKRPCIDLSGRLASHTRPITSSKSY